MKNKLYLLILFLFPVTTFGQAGMWTWVKGDSTLAPAAHFGTQGVPNPNNSPTGLYEACEWTDLQGNFWLFGGQDNNRNVYGDLWKYTVANNTWTWVNGNGQPNAPGSYGTMGVPNINNKPPARALGIGTWVDMNGDLWLYGGKGSSVFNDLWKYNIASNTWTWMNGTSNQTVPAVYGTKGVPSPGNTPGRRYEFSATWVDTNNDLWLFGGFSFYGSYNDLWRYNIASNEWTWMSGADPTEQVGIYGSKGTGAPANVPGARFAYCSWKSKDNKFWLMGGTQYLFRTFDDMWKYDPSNNEWAWMSGSNQPQDNGAYASLCNSSANIWPGARYENRARWTDDCGNFWMYGGDSYNNKSYSDLWLFNPTSLKWTLVNGSSTLNLRPLFNKKGVASASNRPGGKLGSVSWRSNAGDLYLFGGSVDSVGTGLEPLNDVWKFTIDTSCSGPETKPLVTLGNDTTYCNSINRVLTTGNSNTLWSTGVSATQIAITKPSKYWANVTNTCGTGTDTISILLINSPTINLGNDTTYCNSVNRILATNYSNTIWSNGVTASAITVNQPGIYFASDSNTCGTARDTIHISLNLQPAAFSLGNDTTYCTAINRVLLTGNINTLWSTGVIAPQINVASAGTYWANISNSCGTTTDTIKISLGSPPGVFSLGNDTTFCNAVSRILSTGNANTLWSTGATATQINVTSPGVYWAEIFNTCGATRDSIQFSLNNSPLPIASLGPDIIDCDSVKRFLTTGIDSTLWSTGITAQKIAINNPGTYWASVSNTCGTSSDTVSIAVAFAPAFTLDADTSSCNIYELRVPHNILNTSYHWQDNSIDSVIIINRPGTYTLTATNQCGTTSVSKEVNIYSIRCEAHFPNAFSPNGDGINDFFRPVFQCTNRYYLLRVYNRWGQQVFETNDPSFGWDGKYNGIISLVGTYAYYAEYFSECEQKIKRIQGNVTLLR